MAGGDREALEGVFFCGQGGWRGAGEGANEGEGGVGVAVEEDAGAGKAEGGYADAFDSGSELLDGLGPVHGGGRGAAEDAEVFGASCDLDRLIVGGEAGYGVGNGLAVELTEDKDE